MDNPSSTPRPSRQNGRRKSLQGPTAGLFNHVSIQPASPEVISSLITSLSIISSPANALFETNESISVSPLPTKTSFKSSYTAPELRNYKSPRASSGSFGIDYGAFAQPSLRDLQEEGSLDDLAASAPVIRTAKPPSGFSPLTAPKSPGRDSSSLKAFLRGSSRPSSKGSVGSQEKDDVSTIGNVSIEPGTPQKKQELRRQHSSDSWGRKQARNQKGLMYMNSKERLREKEQERKKITEGAAGSKAPLDCFSIPKFDVDSFMAESSVITEEPYISTEHATQTSTSSNTITSSSRSTNGTHQNRNSSLRPGSQGGIGSGRFIPARDSSLRARKAEGSAKRSSHRSSRHSDQQRVDEDDPIQGSEEKGQERKREKARKITQPSEAALKMMEPLENLTLLNQKPKKATTLASKQVAGAAKVEQYRVDEHDDGAPSPAVAQRRSRGSPTREDQSSGKRRSRTTTPEPFEDPSKPKRSSSRLKRLSAPMTPKASGDNQREAKSGVSTPEPVKQQAHTDDRPSSADSIDDAVEAYMCSPRLSQKIRHPQTGRTISFSEVGDSEGHAVFCCVGMGLTRFITAFYDELALTLKLRLITPDRPGVGDSEPYTDGTATPLSWPDDVYAICQALKITKFSILAHSAGAIYALATALRMPQHIRGRIHLLAPWIPPSQLSVVGAQVISPPTNSIPTSQRILRALPTPILKAANSSFMSATSSSITSSLPRNQKRGKRKSTASRDLPAPPARKLEPLTSVDKDNHGRDSTIYPSLSEPGALERAARNPDDPNNEAAILAAAASTLADRERQMTYDARLTHAIWDLATSGANPAVDLLVCLERRHTIGFRYVDITRAVVIHHGSKDTRVPVDNVRWLGKTMKKCEVRVLEGEGHGLMASAAVMGGVLMEIAKEWEDWVKVTTQTSGKETAARRTLRERASVGAFR